MTTETTLGELLKEARDTLAAAGIDTARLDARVLLGAVVEGGEAAVFGYPEREIPAVDVRRVRDLIAKRAARQPLSQVLGHKEFWSLDFEVTEDTLTPRPDTETLIEMVLDAVAANCCAPLRVLDLGTGSGCILLTVLNNLPNATGLGVDKGAGALAVARRNAQHLGLAGRAAFQAGDWAAGIDEAFDLVVSNPPYIPRADIGGLDPEVARFEPILALDGGLDGLDAYRVIAGDALALLKPGGQLFLEVGAGQADAVADLVRAGGLIDVAIRADLGRLDRCVSARRAVESAAKNAN